MDKSAFGMGGAKPAPAPAQPAVDTPLEFTPLDLRPEGEHAALWDPKFCRVMRAWRSLPADVRESIVRLAETPTPETSVTVLGPITAIGILRRVEWNGNDEKWKSCPICAGLKNEGHAPDCDLAAVLREQVNANLAPVSMPLPLFPIADPRLAVLVAAWDTLKPIVRETILYLMDADRVDRARANLAPLPARG